MISLMTMWYNEAFIAPFFLDHYCPLIDNVHIVIDDATNDNTMDIIKEYSNKYGNIETEMFHFPELFDDELKVNKFNEIYKTFKHDGYVILVDSDEFVVPGVLGLINKNVYFVHLWQIFKHETEIDIVKGIPLQVQRRHGYEDSRYIKPIIVKTNNDVKWIPGNHAVWFNGYIYEHRPGDLFGAHWRLLDVDERINRLVNNRCLRQGRRNKEQGRSYQFNNVTAQTVIDDYERNKNLPRVL